MRSLILMRHAKSSWDDPARDDHDRPLNGRGRRSAEAMGDWLRDGDFVPDEVLCSSATRTAETLEGLRLDAPVRFTRALYHASAADMLEVLHSATGESVLMLGHNPGISTFASQILREAPDHPRFWDYPTCATLVARFDIPDWARADWRSAEAVAFTVPREVLD